MPAYGKVSVWSTVALIAIGASWYGLRDHKSVETAEPKVAETHEQPATQHGVSSPKSYGEVESSQWRSADFSSAADRFSELLAHAKAGDVIAQRELGNLYQRCSVFSLSASNMNSMLDTFAKMRGEPDGAYDDIKGRFSMTCTAVDGGQVIPREAYMNWFERAARQGDAFSKIAVASANFSSLKADDYQSIARDAINSGDAEAIFALGDLLAIAPESIDLAEFRSVSGGPYANYAWGIVACRMGAECGAGSFRMDSLCINTGMCGSEGFEEAIRTDAVPLGQHESLDKAIVEVQRVIGKKAT